MLLLAEVVVDKWGGGAYSFGGKSYSYFLVTEKAIVETLEGCGFSDIFVQRACCESLEPGEKLMFLTARKTA